MHANRTSAALLAALLVLSAASLGQGPKGPKKGGGGAGDDGAEETGPVAVAIGPVAKAVDDAIAKNADKSRKEAEALSAELGGEFHAAQGPTIALRAEEPLDRVKELVREGETMLSELCADLTIDPVKDLWAAKQGPFYAYCFKSKANFNDAFPFLTKRFTRHGLDNARKSFVETGRFLSSLPHPLAGGEVHDYEHALAHWIGQNTLVFIVRPNGTLASAPAKEDLETLQHETIAWLDEGMAMYTSVRFLGSNRNYCVTDAKYVGNIAIANKDLDTAYRLVCLEMASGDEKSKAFELLSRTDLNGLDYLDLAKSWSFLDWMMRDANRPKLVALLKGMRGGSFAASVKNNLKCSLPELEENWKTFVREEYGGKKKTTPPKGKGADPKTPGKPAPKKP